MTHPMHAASVRTGQELPILSVAPTALQVFRFSAVTWNPHRIHFDQQYAQSEGYPDVLIQSHLRGALALRCLTEGLGADYAVEHFTYRVRRPATPDRVLTYTARVTDATTGEATVVVAETFDDSALGLEGTAVARVRRRDS